MTYRILILTNSDPDKKMLTETLAKASDGPFTAECSSKLSAGLARLERGAIDLVLVDLHLSDSQGIETFKNLFSAFPHIPILILSGLEEEQAAMEAVELGAQGYLSKGYFSGTLTPQSLRNIIRRKAVEERSDQEQARAQIALNSISDAVICTDIDGHIDYLNAAAETLTGWLKDDAIGLPASDVFKLINGKTRRKISDTVDRVLRQNEVAALPEDTILVRKNGSEAAIEDSISPIHDWSGRLTGAVIVFHDVSIAQALTVKMAHMAHHDFLTNLPNRILLNDRIDQAITLARRKRTQLALLFVDLDNFKQINDSCGHAAGDLLLKSVAQRLSDSVRGSDTVSRQGGDEFVVLLGSGKYDEEVAQIAHKILDSMALPFEVAGTGLHVTASIGISLYPTDGTDAETLINNADTAMYHAKQIGKNNFQFFRNDMNIRATERRVIETDLRLALEKNEFLLHYQPTVNLVTGKISGAEALLRWDHPKWGMVMPDQYLHIAEECGMIVPIGHWVLREACQQTQKWLNAGLPPISMAVNISALEFRQLDFLEGVDRILNETGLKPASLQLEVTESVLMKDPALSKIVLDDLKDMGIQLAVDDFGTGCSSLSYLNQFPLDFIKIDQSFVDGIGKSGDTGIIVGAAIGMGNNLKMSVIAEGVETENQLQFLKERDCLEGQGFLFGRPVGTEQFASLLASNKIETTRESAR